MTREARRFARQLEGRFHLPVYPVDERLSSIEAGQLMHDSDSGQHRARRRRGIDALAAQVILQTWFSEARGDAPDPADG
jgi:putative holliday junction resolvase